MSGPPSPPHPPSYDEDLLKRLNALRQTNITLQDSKPALSVPRSVPTRHTDLSARLNALRNGSHGGAAHNSQPRSSPPVSLVFPSSISSPAASCASPSPLCLPPSASLYASLPGNLLSEFKSEVSSVLHDIKGFSPGSLDSQQLQRLLEDAQKAANSSPKPMPSKRVSSATLPQQEDARNERDWMSVLDNENVAEWLKGDAEDALGELRRSTSSPESQKGDETRESGSSDGDENDDDDDERSSETESERAREEREAEAILAQVMDECEFELAYESEPTASAPPPRPENASNHIPNTKSSPSPSLPSVPSSLPQPLPEAEPEPDTDSFEAQIAARMAALSDKSTDPLDLPSAPTTLPSKAANKPPPPPEVPYWCVICNDDATILCTGCQEDFGGEAQDALYCARCWKEGHLGREANEARGHEWVKFKRPK